LTKSQVGSLLEAGNFGSAILGGEIFFKKSQMQHQHFLTQERLRPIEKF
jgi:hypothetical protein